MSTSRRGKKIADALFKILSQSISSEEPLPEEYVVMKVAERFHKLPHEIRQMPERDYRMLLMLMGAEAEAQDLKGKQAKHYGR